MKKRNTVIYLAVVIIVILAGVVVYVLQHDSNVEQKKIKEAIIHGEDIENKAGIVPLDLLRENAANNTATVLTKEQAQQIIEENNSHYTTAFSKDYDALWVAHENNLITYYTLYSFEDLPVYEIRVGGGCLGVQPLSIEIHNDTATAAGTVYSYSVYIDYDKENGTYRIDLSFWETPHTKFKIVKREGNWVLDAADHSSEGEEVPHTDPLKEHYDTLEQALTAAEQLDIEAVNPIQ